MYGDLCSIIFPSVARQCLHGQGPTTALPLVGDLIGDIEQYAAPDDIVEAVRCKYQGVLPESNITRSGGQLWNFCHLMQCGDLVIYKGNDGRNWKDSVVMLVTGPYKYVDPPPPLNRCHV